MLRCRDELHRQGVQAVLLAQIHDELLFEVAEPLLQRAARCVQQCMRTVQLEPAAPGFPAVPFLPVSMVAGTSWGRMQTVTLPEEASA